MEELVKKEVERQLTEFKNNLRDIIWLEIKNYENRFNIDCQYCRKNHHKFQYCNAKKQEDDKIFELECEIAQKNGYSFYPS